jgi:hypothetical protein
LSRSSFHVDRWELKSIAHGIRRLHRVTPDSTRGVYVLCAAVVLLAFVMAEDTGLRSMWPYYALLVLCAVQAWRPTLFVWCVLMTVFLAGLATVIFAGTATRDERFFFATLIGVPVIALWFFRPRPKNEGDPSR